MIAAIILLWVIYVPILISSILSKFGFCKNKLINCWLSKLFSILISSLLSKLDQFRYKVGVISGSVISKCKINIFLYKS